tara:strand:+ start:2493 stop:5099 length:2607 start_codon:yes stop_codon:yes gene_type:complete
VKAKNKNIKKKETPLMGQYNRIKAKYPLAILLFRVGDFYETFGKDAVKASKILGITLTKRSNGSSNEELAGFPHHALDTYLPKLVRAGQRVAICDQLEDPKASKGIVKRGVTELVTPGVAYNDKVLDFKKNNFLASLHFDDNLIGVSFLDISTGEFLITEGSYEYVAKLLQSFSPNEVVFQNKNNEQFLEIFGDNYYTFKLDDWVFNKQFTDDKLLNHFEMKSLKGFGIDDLNLGKIAAGSILHYLAETHHHHLKHINNLKRIEGKNYLWMDRFTIKNLELFSSHNDDAVTLIDVIDSTTTPMGARLLKRWLAFPLKDVNLINDRLSIVNLFIKKEETSSLLIDHIKQIGDLERLVSKVATSRINPKEVVQLKKALLSIAPIKSHLFELENKSLKEISNELNSCSTICDKIDNEIFDDPPFSISKGQVIRSGVNKELDELRTITKSSQESLKKILERETEITKIPSLKIAFNNVFGYYLEVRNTHKDKVPQEWIRKQTLVNAERYITEELKILESKILGAEDKILALENKLFNDLVLDLVKYLKPIQINAKLISKLDCLLSFSIISKSNNYVKPDINISNDLIVKNGRHPVIEKKLVLGEKYVGNDLNLNRDNQQIIMITGPNMSGKSALLRQTALIVLMAQIGCFVPADSANIGLVDKIFTRVGASDNISMGESTFMVEMNETASILNNLSDRSLILLDEIGRGTSTYDGISIAWSIAEYLHQSKFMPKTLFATHYHELNEMSNIYERIKNYNVSVKEIQGKIIFLRKLVKGGISHSFGIHVAKLAGMPKQVLNRAKEILVDLEKNHSSNNFKIEKQSKDDLQLSFFKLDDPVLEQIRDNIIDLNINELTPVEALLKLNEIKKLISK